MKFGSNSVHATHTAQKMKFSMINFFSKCDQIHSFLRIWSHLPKNCLMEKFIFCVVAKSKFKQESRH